MTFLHVPSPATGSIADRGLPVEDRPSRRGRISAQAAWELVGCLGAALAFVLVVFAVVGSHPLFGMFVCWLFTFLVLYGVLTRLLHGALRAKDRFATACICVGASVALFPLFQIVLSVAFQGAPVVFSHFPAFLVQSHATAPTNGPVWKDGMGHAIVGTVEQVGLATVYTVPISILTATYLSETSSVFSRFVRTIVDCMMGTPSIIAGLFVYLFWVQPRGTSGHSGLAASIALAVLMLPIMIRTAEEVIRVVPGSLREAALALGSPRWRVSLQIVLPTIRTGLITAVILGVALGVGETAPVLFTALGSEHYNFNPFHGPQANLTVQILPLITSSSASFVRSAWGGAFILVSMVLGLFIAARVIGASPPGGRRPFVPWRIRKEITV